MTISASALPLSTAQAISGRRFCAVGGTSLLQVSRRAINQKGPIAYFDFCGLIEFIEALLLHRRVLILSPTDLSSEDADFLRLVNKELGSDVMEALEGESAFERTANTPEVRRRMREYLVQAFGDVAPPLSPGLLKLREQPTRTTDDYKQYIIGRFASILDESCQESPYDRLSELMLSELDRSSSSADGRFVMYHLFRVFHVAAVAAIYDGSVLAVGLRKYVVGLLQARTTRRAPVTLSKRFYDLATAGFRVATRPVATQTEMPFVPLGLAYLFTHTDTKKGLLSALARSRNELAGFREKMDEFNASILDENIPLRDRVKTYHELLVTGSENLMSIMEQLKIPRAGIRGMVQRFWRESIDSVASVPDATLDAEGLDASVSLTGLATVTVGATRRAVKERKYVNKLGGLLTLVEKVLDSSGLVPKVGAALEVADFDSRLAIAYENAAYPPYHR